MRRSFGGAALFMFLAAPGFAHASTGSGQETICIRIDEAHDTLGAEDRNAALLVLGKQFTLAGEQVVADCDAPYLLAHVKLGKMISVSLAGPKGAREGTALGLEDLAPLYSQMVRSLETGKPMTGLNVIDRTNVTAAQSTANRVHSDGFTYARLGYSGMYAGRAYGTPSFGFGHRVELDHVAIDVSFLNFAIGEADPGYSYSGTSRGSASAWSLIKLSGLYMLNNRANATPYVGAGLSWGVTSITPDRSASYPAPSSSAPYTYTTVLGKSGLQGELTAGYEFARSTTIRSFVQADAILPFYSLTSETITVNRAGPIVSSRASRYAPSLVVSVGLGWQKNRK
jgi:hypothetical protein